MKPEDVPEGWVVAAMDAYSDNEWRTSVAAFRAAITAVAPLIAAREREECAKLAELREMGNVATFDGLGPPKLSVEPRPKFAGGTAVASAIRARGNT